MIMEHVKPGSYHLPSHPIESAMLMDAPYLPFAAILALMVSYPYPYANLRLELEMYMCSDQVYTSMIKMASCPCHMHEFLIE